jgi:ubiquinone/menaquinone biosynthesis C-methylase UbiE
MKNRVQQYFDQQAPTWEDYYKNDGAMHDRIRRFREALQSKLSPESFVLDFGCGSGDLSNSVAVAGYRVVGMDRAKKMITRAAQRFSSKRVTFQWLGDSHSGSSLPFPDGVFDAIICSSVLEYVDNLGCYLKELSRVCRPGGWLFATVPNMMHPKRSIERVELILRSMFVYSRRTGGGRLEYLVLSKNRFSVRRWQWMLEENEWKAHQIAGRAADLLLITAQRVEERSPNVTQPNQKQ